MLDLYQTPNIAQWWCDISVCLPVATELNAHCCMTVPVSVATEVIRHCGMTVSVSVATEMMSDTVV